MNQPHTARGATVGARERQGDMSSVQIDSPPPRQDYPPISAVQPLNPLISDTGLAPRVSGSDTQLINTDAGSASVASNERNNLVSVVDGTSHGRLGFHFSGSSIQRMPFSQNPSISFQNQQRPNVHILQAPMSPIRSSPVQIPPDISNSQCSHASSSTQTASFVYDSPSTNTSGYTTDYLSDVVRSGIPYANVASSTPSHISNCSPNVSPISASELQTHHETHADNLSPSMQAQVQPENHHLSQQDFASRMSPYGIMQPTNTPNSSGTLHPINTPPLGMFPNGYPLDSDGEITSRVNPHTLYEETDKSADNHQSSFQPNTNVDGNETEQGQNPSFHSDINLQIHQQAQEYSTPSLPYHQAWNHSTMAGEFSAHAQNSHPANDPPFDSGNLHDIGQLQSTYEDNINHESVFHPSLSSDIQLNGSMNISVHDGHLDSQSIIPSDMLVQYESLQEPDTFDLEHLRNRTQHLARELNNTISTQTEPLPPDGQESTSLKTTSHSDLDRGTSPNRERLETASTGEKHETSENGNESSPAIHQQDLTEENNPTSDENSPKNPGKQVKNSRPSSPCTSQETSKASQNTHKSSKSATKKTPPVKKSSSAKQTPALKNSRTVKKKMNTPTETTPNTRAKKRQAETQQQSDDEEEVLEEQQKAKTPQSLRSRLKYFLRPTPAKEPKSDK